MLWRCHRCQTVDMALKILLMSGDKMGPSHKLINLHKAKVNSYWPMAYMDTEKP